MRDHSSALGHSRYAATHFAASLPDRLLFGLALAAAVGWVLPQMWPPLNGDVSAILYFARRMLAGDRLYIDLVDVNPPVVFWLSMLPAWLTERTGIGIGAAFALFVLGMTALSLRLAEPAVQALFRDRPLARAFAPLLGLFVLLIMPAHNFGQREHLMVIAALPYLALAAQRLAGLPAAPAAAVGAALLGAVGFCIKPYFALVPLAVELLLLARFGLRGWLRRPELWGLAGAATLIVGAVLLLTPSYLTEIVPLVGRQYVTVGLQPMLEVLLDEDRWILELGLVVLAAVALLRRDAAALPFACLTLAGLGAALIQGKGWDYHLLPAWSGLALGAGLLGVSAAERFAEQLPARPLAGAAALLALMIGLHITVQPPFEAQQRYAMTHASQLEKVLAREAEDRPILWLSSSIYPQFPTVLYSRSQMATRFMNLWVIDSVYRSETAGRSKDVYRQPRDMGLDERLVFNETASALERLEPVLLLVAPASEEVGFAGKPFDYIEYFGRHPSFAAALENYDELPPVGATRIFRRRD